jgi:hypothetical protein
MSLVYTRRRARAQAHALVIGVGAYRHLEGGLGKPLEDSMAMGQLTSPPASAKLFADWLIKRYRNPDVPLGSVEMLVSPTGSYDVPEGRSVNVAAATMSNVKQAFDRWFSRCDSSADNTAFFYFCGHGIEKERLVLLLEDFGARPNRLFENAMNFGLTHLGMATCRASLQAYFIDSCRLVPSKTLDTLEVNAPGMVDAPAKPRFSRSAPVYLATARDRAAYAFADAPTQFTATAIRALDGLGAQNRGGAWQVTPSHVSTAVRDLMEAFASDQALLPAEDRIPPQFPGSDLKELAVNRVICHLASPPQVPVRVSCRPEDAGAAAELRLEQGATCFTRIPMPGSWDQDVPAGTYRLTATFPGGQYRVGPQTTLEVIAYPPMGAGVVEALP